MDSFKIENSENLVLNELQLFKTPPTQSSVNSVNFIEIRPVNPLIDGSPVEFVVPNNSSQYVDLKGTKLYVKAKLIKDDGSDLDMLPTISNVAPVTGWLHALWQQVEVQLNQQNISSSLQFYPYKAHVKSLLNFPPEAHDSRLKSHFFFMDQPTIKNVVYMDDSNCQSGNNTGLKDRCMETLNSSIVDMQGRIFEDVFDTDRLLVNGVEVKMKLTPSRDAFQLMSDEDGADYRVKLMDVYLRVPMKSLSPSILMRYEEELKMKNAIYPYDENQIKAYTIPAGQQSFAVDDAFQGTVPTRLLCFMVKSAAVTGSYKLNPFNYHHFRVNYLDVSVNGSSVPEAALRPTFGFAPADKLCIREYDRLFSDLEEDQGLIITPHLFRDGYSLFKFDLQAQDKTGKVMTFPLIKKGNVRVSVQFAVPLEEPTNLMLMATFPQKFEVNAQRNIILQ